MSVDSHYLLHRLTSVSLLTHMKTYCRKETLTAAVVVEHACQTSEKKESARVFFKLFGVPALPGAWISVISEEGCTYCEALFGQSK